MQTSEQTIRKKRKGISVSLSPYKKVQSSQQKSKVNTPIKQKVILQQSIVKPQDLQSYFHNVPRYVRIQPVIKSAKNSNVKYCDSTLKQCEEKEGIVLDEQLFTLKRQIENKKKNIQILSNKPKTLENREVKQNLIKYQQASFKNVSKNQLQREEKLIEVEKKVKNIDQSKQKSGKLSSKRIQRLKLAQQKLLNIIKICDNGL